MALGRTNDYLYTAQDTLATMSTPPNGSALASSSVALTWNASPTSTGYYLFVGSSPGATDVYVKSEGVKLTDTVNCRWTGARSMCPSIPNIHDIWVYKSYTTTRRMPAPWSPARPMGAFCPEPQCLRLDGQPPGYRVPARDRQQARAPTICWQRSRVRT